MTLRILSFCRYKVTLLLLFVTVCITSGCNESSPKKERNVEKAFYHWKSIVDLTAYEKNRLSELKVNTLYLKFFDVDWDNNSKKPVPIAQVRLTGADSLGQYFKNIIPVVFISNSCIRYLDSLQAEGLGVKISNLINNICEANHLEFSELQIDCDWTELSKEKYFTVLRSIKKHQLKKNISATIRLYQIKYSGKTGIPPVDRGLLMAYNMGNLKDPSTNNSIIESKELKKYVSPLSSYPLQLDIGLPLFEWKVLFRNNIYAGLIESFPDTLLNNTAVKKLQGNRFQFLKDTALKGYSFLKGDILRKEESSFEEITAVEKILSKNLSTRDIRLSLFHLDSLILKKYAPHEMETIFNGLR